MRRLAIAALALVLLSGCEQYAAPNPPPIPPTRDDLVGEWVHTDDDSSAGATLQLNDDGSLSFSGIPVEVLENSSDGRFSADLRSGTGTWDYDENQTVFSRLQVSVELDEFGSRELDFGAEVVGAPADLVFVIGDPDSGEFYSLERQY